MYSTPPEFQLQIQFETAEVKKGGTLEGVPGSMTEILTRDYGYVFDSEITTKDGSNILYFISEKEISEDRLVEIISTPAMELDVSPPYKITAGVLDENGGKMEVSFETIYKKGAWKGVIKRETVEKTIWGYHEVHKKWFIEL